MSEQPVIAIHPIVPTLEVGAAEVARQMGRLLTGQVVELRALGVTLPGERPRDVLSGYFDNAHDFANAAAYLDGHARGIYWSLNPLRSEVLRRAPNQLRPHIPAAKDVDVLVRRFLPLDFDPVRPKGTSSTDEELGLALWRACLVWRTLRARGWPDPLPALSGNGWHLLYRLPDLPPSDPTAARILRNLSSEFSDAHVRLDSAVSNPARIWKAYGTLACKGPNTPMRPWRRATLLLGVH